ncbi:hypothetical protein J2X46_002361 [Nocardioides sp. BE266]|nr:hypothetical protein [Nocardioides sp. BE266]MDR7253376.1 hypothetical protein [Nocardioides sp. BE266]
MTPDTYNLPLLTADAQGASDTVGGCCGGGGCCSGNTASAEDSVAATRPA